MTAPNVPSSRPAASNEEPIHTLTPTHVSTPWGSEERHFQTAGRPHLWMSQDKYLTYMCVCCVSHFRIEPSGLHGCKRPRKPDVSIRKCSNETNQPSGGATLTLKQCVCVCVCVRVNHHRRTRFCFTNCLKSCLVNWHTSSRCLGELFTRQYIWA